MPKWLRRMQSGWMYYLLLQYLAALRWFRLKIYNRKLREYNFYEQNWTLEISCKAYGSIKKIQRAVLNLIVHPHTWDHHQHEHHSFQLWCIKPRLVCMGEVGMNCRRIWYLQFLAKTLIIILLFWSFIMKITSKKWNEHVEELSG